MPDINRRQAVGWAVVALAALAAGAWLFRPGRDDAERVREAPFEVWAVYDGVLESREVRNVMSLLDGPATVVEVIPDGMAVRAGDVLVRFDASQWDRDLLRSGRDAALARAELSALENAKLPLELRDIESRLAEARERQSEEDRALADERQLLDEKLIPPSDVRQQEARCAAAKAQVESLVEQLELTRKFLHPSAIERAKATAAAAEQELAAVQKQLSNCVVRAGCDGSVSWKPVPVGGEIRLVRVGDTVFRNQPFMTVSDTSNLVVRFEVPEPEVAKVRAGALAMIRPLAYPEAEFNGAVEAVSGVAQVTAGRAAGGLRGFGAMVRPEAPDERLRPGMTVRVRVLCHARQKAILVPRLAVSWEGGRPKVKVWRGRCWEEVVPSLGLGNETHFEVLNGLVPGDRVATR